MCANMQYIHMYVCIYKIIYHNEYSTTTLCSIYNKFIHHETKIQDYNIFSHFNSVYGLLPDLMHMTSSLCQPQIPDIELFFS